MNLSRWFALWHSKASTIAGDKPCPKYTGYTSLFYEALSMDYTKPSWGINNREGCDHDVNTESHHTTSPVTVSLRYDFIRHRGGWAASFGGSSQSSPKGTQFGGITCSSRCSKSGWSSGLAQLLECAASAGRMPSEDAQRRCWNVKGLQNKLLNTKHVIKLDGRTGISNTWTCGMHAISVTQSLVHQESCSVNY